MNETTTGTKTLQTGTYFVEAACPRCGAIEEILVGIRAVVTIPENEVGSLKVRLRQKARDHDCRQNRIQLVSTETGELIE